MTCNSAWRAGPFSNTAKILLDYYSNLFVKNLNFKSLNGGVGRGCGKRETEYLYSFISWHVCGEVWGQSCGVASLFHVGSGDRALAAELTNAFTFLAISTAQI